MTEEIKEPWKHDTNNKYSEVVKTIMGLSTASLLLPVFMAREFLGIETKKPLVDVLGCSVYWAWGLLALSILASIFFLYLSAKWIRIAWGKEAGIFWSKNTSESTVERLMEISFWSCVLLFGIGLFLTIMFFVNYANGL
ncbi:hypothetical protein [Geothermobacter hydrogeniphilus]|uniref:hypothetical protein n=1 Tax=Geothermobacter hydrogeniphilus TaxID=1969733 RepID=UPI0011AF34F2|nr:hypothetical protein [Geothermobacter hydrogeniphilus]